ncbi:MAG: hypothetical protein LVO36_04055 [Nitrosopumilus sp. (ex Thoosa mismalolli)]|nr:hypothetical protein [Nitrosopumilus sp. (ex Thoosa mismalolli)]
MGLDRFPESVFERRLGGSQDKDDKKMKLDMLQWYRKMSDSQPSKIYENDFTEPTIFLSVNESIDSDLQSLSQKIMEKTWDNKEDEFWDTY